MDARNAVAAFGASDVGLRRSSAVHTCCGRFRRPLFARWTIVLGFCLLAAASMGAKHRTRNFIVETADPRFAVQMAEAAEHYRRELALQWLGRELPDWRTPCPMTVRVGPNLGAGGATSFVFDRGDVFGWRMNIQGSSERLLDSVLPHEITHMILASHFRRPVPRWADEGAATSVESAAERHKHRQMLYQFLHSGRGIAFSRLFAMREYPTDILPLYAQGHSLAEYLIELGGRQKFIEFVGEGMKTENWPAAVERHYAARTLGELQNQWLAWVREGSPPLKRTPNYPAPAGPIELAAAAGQWPAADGRAGTASAPPATGKVWNGSGADALAAVPVRVAPPHPISGGWEPADDDPRPPLAAMVSGPSGRPASAQPAAAPAGSAASAVVAAAPGNRQPPSGNYYADIAAGRIPPPTSASTAESFDSPAQSVELTRPQPYEQPKQAILQWSRPRQF